MKRKISAGSISAVLAVRAPQHAPGIRASVDKYRFCDGSSRSARL